MKKSTLFILLTSSLQLSAITSNMTHRIMSTSPLLYKMIDYSDRQMSYEIKPIFSSMYDTQHTVSNLIPQGKQTLTFDQQGLGDINPTWLDLMSNNSLANYNSKVTFTPKFTEAGALLHCYNQFDTAFIEIKTALVQCKSEIKIDEIGGGNGLNLDIDNAQQAFTQSSWNYGKIGDINYVSGLDNIELRFGAVTEIPHRQESYDMFFSGFAIIEAPTGSGTKAKWLFEPQVGTNHWGIGLGTEALFMNNNDIQLMIAGNFRYLTPAWETRSFDLTNNGPWSRYLLLQETYGLPSSPSDGQAGINLFTQPAYIQGRSELNFYTRLTKQVESCLFELSYNYFYLQPEKIRDIATIMPGYGIYALTGTAGGLGGDTTASNATINQSTTIQDDTPIDLTTSMLDKNSASAGSYATNTLVAQIKKVDDFFIYGLGASIEIAQSTSAISSWAIWAKFEFLFDN